MQKDFHSLRIPPIWTLVKKVDTITWYRGSTSTSQMVALNAWSDVARAMPISSRFSSAGMSPSVPHWTHLVQVIHQTQRASTCHSVDASRGAGMTAKQSPRQPISLIRKTKSVAKQWIACRGWLRIQVQRCHHVTVPQSCCNLWWWPPWPTYLPHPPHLKTCHKTRKMEKGLETGISCNVIPKSRWKAKEANGQMWC